MEMEKTDKIPIWVYLAFSAISTRKGALWLIWACVAFTLYCIPWPRFFTNPDWLASVFLIDDWSWFAMMVPITLWYWISLKWTDTHHKWGDTGQTAP